MIHVVFNGSEISLMEDVMKLDATLGDEVVQIREEFGVGPLAGMDIEDGWKLREDWWKEMIKDSPYQNDPLCYFNDSETVKKIQDQLKADNHLQVWIWIGQNQHDVCGYYWLIRYLKEWLGRIFVIYLNNLPFINEKGQLFYPSWLHEIRLPREVLKAKRLARPVTMSEFETDPDEWKRLCNENSIVRILEGGKKIVSQDESFYDAEIMKNITAEWQKATRVLMNTLHRMKIKTGDLFLMWRLKKLIIYGKVEVLGDMNKGWKEFDVKWPALQQTEATESEEVAI